MKRVHVFFLLVLFACASYAQVPQKTGVLREAVQIPLLMNGKQVGMSTAAAGSKVQVVSEAGGKLLVAVSGGQGWVSPEKVDVVQNVPEDPAIAAATPAPAMPLAAGQASKPSAQEKTGSAVVNENKQSPVSSQPASHTKKILFVASRQINRAEQAIIATLKEQGIDVKIAGKNGELISSAFNAGNKDSTKKDIVPDFSIVSCIEDRKTNSDPVVLMPEMLGEYDGFIFANYKNDNSWPALAACAINKPIVCGESSPPRPHANQRPGMAQAGELKLLSMTENGNRLYYLIYNRDRNAPAPEDSDMETFVREKLVPAIKQKIESPPKTPPDSTANAFTVVMASAWDTTIPVARIGSGSKGIVFFGHNGNSMAADIRDSIDAYEPLIKMGWSLFLFEYPLSAMIEAAQKNKTASGKEKYPGFATQLVNSLRDLTKVNQFCLVGNSFGGGLILWDYDELAKDRKTSFLLISPTPQYMPEVLDSMKTLQQTNLISVEGDQWFPGNTMPPFISKNASPLSKAYAGKGHLIVGQNLPHQDVNSLIQSTLVKYTNQILPLEPIKNTALSVIAGSAKDKAQLSNKVLYVMNSRTMMAADKSYIEELKKAGYAVSIAADKDIENEAWSIENSPENSIETTGIKIDLLRQNAIPEEYGVIFFGIANNRHAIQTPDTALLNNAIAAKKVISVQLMDGTYDLEKYIKACASAADWWQKGSKGYYTSKDLEAVGIIKKNFIGYCNENLDRKKPPKSADDQSKYFKKVILPLIKRAQSSAASI